MKCALVVIRATPSEASPVAICRNYDIERDDFDHSFGVVSCGIPEQQLYTIRVREPIADALRDREGVEAVYTEPLVPA